MHVETQMRLQLCHADHSPDLAVDIVAPAQACMTALGDKTADHVSSCPAEEIHQTTAIPSLARIGREGAA